MRRGLERALDECLSQLNTGEVGLEEVLSRYPEHEAELRPLLRTAMLIRQVPQAVPSLEAKAAGRRRLLSAVARKRREKAQARPGLLRRLEQSASILVQPWVRPQRQSLRLAQAIAALFIIVSLIGAGTVGVAADSLPDSPLYPIKRAAERVQLAFTTTAAGQAQLHMSYSERRGRETQALLEAGQGLNEETLQGMKSARSDALTAIGRVPEQEKKHDLLDDLVLLAEKQQETLEEIRPEVPPSDQEAVEEALEATEEHQRVARKAMTEPDLLFTPSPMPRPTDTATLAPPTATATSVPTATPVPPTATATSVPTATPVPPTATPVPPTATPVPPTATPVPPTATPIPMPTAKPTATPTTVVETPPPPTVEPTATPTTDVVVPPTPAMEPTITPRPTPTAVPTPTPTAMPTPTPTVEPTATPTPEVEEPSLPMPASSVTNCRVSDAPQGAAVTEFPAGTAKVYVVFDYAYMAGEEVGIKVTDNVGHVLREEVRTLSGDGTVSISVSGGEGGFTDGPYLVNIYQGGVIRTIIWDVAP